MLIDATPYPKELIGAITLRLLIVSVFFLNDNEPEEKVHYVHSIFPEYKMPLFYQVGANLFSSILSTN